MTNINYDIPSNSPISENKTQNKAAYQSEEVSMISVPWHEWTGNIGTAMNKVRDGSQAMTTLDPATATLSEMVTAWEALRVILQGII